MQWEFSIPSLVTLPLMRLPALSGWAVFVGYWPKCRKSGPCEAIRSKRICLSRFPMTARNLSRFTSLTVRVVCANTHALATKGVKATYSIRHTLNAPERVEQAHRICGLQDKNAQAFQKIRAVPRPEEVVHRRRTGLCRTILPLG